MQDIMIRFITILVILLKLWKSLSREGWIFKQRKWHDAVQCAERITRPDSTLDGWLQLSRHRLVFIPWTDDYKAVQLTSRKQTVQTRGSASAEEPRDAVRQLKSYGCFVTELLTRSFFATAEKPCEHKCSTDCIWKRLQAANDLQGHSRSLPLLPFDRPYTISY